MSTSIARAADVFQRFVTGAHVCPECGSDDDEHEDNGESPTSALYALRCTRCDCQWEPNAEHAA